MNVEKREGKHKECQKIQDHYVNIQTDNKKFLV